jgi:hypothetical protein
VPDTDAVGSSDSAPESFFFMSYPPAQFRLKRLWTQNHMPQQHYHMPQQHSQLDGSRFPINQLRRDMHRLMTPESAARCLQHHHPS